MGDLKLRFYDVDKAYLDFLRQSEITKRGFTKIPDIEYETNNKFVCGVVLNINEFNYYAPITSFSEQQRSNILIYDKEKAVSSIRFCFMFPVPNNLISVKNFKNVKQDYRNLLNKEYKFCNANRERIITKAKRVYDNVINNYNKKFNDSCCDFKLLESKCLEYIKHMEAESEVATEINE